MNEADAISIAVRPAPHYPHNEKRRLAPEDYQAVHAWITRNAQHIIDYWDMKIDYILDMRECAFNRIREGDSSRACSLRLDNQNGQV